MMKTTHGVYRPRDEYKQTTATHLLRWGLKMKLTLASEIIDESRTGSRSQTQ